MFSASPGVIPRISAFFFAKVGLVCFFAFFAVGLRAQNDPDRPHLSHQNLPMERKDDATEANRTITANQASRTAIDDGLALPTVGHVWARDNIEGHLQLVQIKYVHTEVDRHTASNILKENMAPFIYKQKQSIEIQGASASVRLHDPNVRIYVRGYGIETSDDAAESAETSTQMDLTLVKMETRKDRRVISTIAFTQITGKASRSTQTIVLGVEKLGNTDWQKLTPSEPLQPGEYALMCMPRGKNLLPTHVFDFAVDPKAPANPNALK